MRLKTLRSKYGAKPKVVDGIRFASTKEARRYQELKMLEKAGQITELKLQPVFPLWVSSQVDQRAQPVNIGFYLADFAYVENGYRPFLNSRVVEDVKGVKTALYKWKKKHVEAQYGIQIREV